MRISILINHVRFALFLAIIFTTGNVYAESKSDQDGVSFVEIKEYAKLSSAAYLAEPSIRTSDLLKNYKFTHYGNIPEIGIAYYLVTDEFNKTQIIAVRGTSNVESAIVDVSLKLAMDKRAGVALHSGFSQAADAIYKEVQPHLKTGYIINTTGHSLGGAAAMILAMYLDVDNYKSGKVVTFGQPKVTNVTGANKFKHLNIIRVVTQKDIVPLVPPFDMLDLNNIDIYWHAGREVVLLPDNTYAVLEGVKSMMRASKFTQAPPSESNIQNHQMSLYIQMINKKIPTARLVPFKNNLNLFNLFGSKQQ